VYMVSLSGTGRSALAMLSAATIASGANPAAAQVATGGAPTREEINRAPTTATPRAPSRLTVESQIERAPCPLADPRFAGVTTTVTQVVFNNLRVVSPELLRPAYEGLLGKTVPIAAVCEIRDAAATILRREGYLAAVQVPPQRIENGVIHFDVLMAKIVQIQVRGDAGKSERLIAGYLEALKGEEVFNERTAERYLLLARDLPGYDVRLTLRPAGTKPGEVLGEVTVVRTPVAIDANIQNYGSRDVGRFGGLIRGEAYDLLGFGDRLTLGFFSTADFTEQKVLQAGYDMRVGREGLTLSGRFTYAWTKPDLGALADIRSRTLLGSAEASYPFVRGQTANLRGALGVDLVNQTVELPANARTRDRLRVAYARFDFDATDPASISGLAGFSSAEPRWRTAGTASGAELCRREQGLRPDPLRRLLRDRRGAAEPGGWTPGRDGDPFHRHRRVPAVAEDRLFALPARAICIEGAVQLRGIFRRQLYRRARLRSGFADRRRRAGRAGGGAHRQPAAAQPPRHCGAALRLLRSRMGVEQERPGRPRLPRSAATLVRGRWRSRQHGRGGAARRGGGGAARPCRAADAAWRYAAAGFADDPFVAVGALIRGGGCDVERDVTNLSTVR
jgi:hypothetical protein